MDCQKQQSKGFEEEGWMDEVTFYQPTSSKQCVTNYQNQNVTQICSSKNDIISNLNLRLVSEISPKYQHLFASYPCFNAIQSKVMDVLLFTDDPVVLSAPTGSGKTVIFELAIVRLLEKIEMTNYTNNFKIVYMAPVKALCNERMVDWNAKFSVLGLRCLEITGDSDNMDLNSILNYHLILTTPEKWDSMTRKWRDHMALVQLVKLFLIDEVHLLNEEKRGPILEAVVSRMKTVQETLKYSCEEASVFRVRFIAVSATIPNIEDLAEWLGDTPESPATFEKIGEEMRPVKLHKIVKGYPFKHYRSSFMFDINLSYKIKPLIFEYSSGKPTLIFCSTRKSVQQTSSVLVQDITFHFTPAQKEKIQEASSQLMDRKISETLLHGVGYHHAGISAEDRYIVAELFRNGYLPILVATSTLAMGVNLPAHLVIIKSTQQYISGLMQEYSEGQILQMMGRAGRPQFDTSATVVIMTKDVTKAKYERLVSGKELVESTLHRYLPEHLNAEIVLRTVCDVAVAMNWIRSTFLYVRASRNPRHYGIPLGLSKEAFEARLQDLCMRELNALARYQLVTLSEGYYIQTTETGSLMAKFYIAFETMKLFSQVKGTEKLSELIALLSKSHEFADIQLRINERSLLNMLNKNKDRDTIQYTLPGRIKTKEMKINCLIQAVLGCLPISDPSLNQEALKIVRIGVRLAKGLALYLWKKPHFQSLVSSLLLAKCLQCKLWNNTLFVAKQLPNIGPALSALLVSAGKTTFKSIIQSNPRDLERILNRHPPLGNHLQEAVSKIPEYNLEMTLTDLKSPQIQVTVKLVNPGEGNQYHRMHLVIGDSSNNILHKTVLQESSLQMQSGVYTKNILINYSGIKKEVIAYLISDTWAGIDRMEKVMMTPANEPTIIQTPLDKFIQRQKSVRSTNSKPSLLNEKSKTLDSRIPPTNLLKRPATPNINIEHFFKLQKKLNTPCQSLDCFSFTPRKKMNLNMVESESIVSSTQEENNNSSSEFKEQQHYIDDKDEDEIVEADSQTEINNYVGDPVDLTDDELLTSHTDVTDDIPDDTCDWTTTQSKNKTGRESFETDDYYEQLSNINNKTVQYSKYTNSKYDMSDYERKLVEFRLQPEKSILMSNEHKQHSDFKNKLSQRLDCDNYISKNNTKSQQVNENSQTMINPKHDLTKTCETNSNTGRSHVIDNEYHQEIQSCITITPLLVDELELETERSRYTQTRRPTFESRNFKPLFLKVDDIQDVETEQVSEEENNRGNEAEGYTENSNNLTQNRSRPCENVIQSKISFISQDLNERNETPFTQSKINDITSEAQELQIIKTAQQKELKTLNHETTIDKDKTPIDKDKTQLNQNDVKLQVGNLKPTSINENKLITCVENESLDASIENNDGNSDFCESPIQKFKMSQNHYTDYHQNRISSSMSQSGQNNMVNNLEEINDKKMFGIESCPPNSEQSTNLSKDVIKVYNKNLNDTETHFVHDSIKTTLSQNSKLHIQDTMNNIKGSEINNSTLNIDSHMSNKLNCDNENSQVIKFEESKLSCKKTNDNNDNPDNSKTLNRSFPENVLNRHNIIYNSEMKNEKISSQKGFGNEKVCSPKSLKLNVKNINIPKYHSVFQHKSPTERVYVNSFPSRESNKLQLMSPHRIFKHQNSSREKQEHLNKNNLTPKMNVNVDLSLERSRVRTSIPKSYKPVDDNLHDDFDDLFDSDIEDKNSNEKSSVIGNCTSPKSIDDVNELFDSDIEENSTNKVTREINNCTNSKYISENRNHTRNRITEKQSPKLQEIIENCKMSSEDWETQVVKRVILKEEPSHKNKEFSLSRYSSPLSSSSSQHNKNSRYQNENNGVQPCLLPIKSATSQIPLTARTSPLKKSLFSYRPSPAASGYYGNESMYDSDSGSIYQNNSHTSQTFDVEDKSNYTELTNFSMRPQPHNKDINLQESAYNSYLMSSPVNLPYLEASPKKFTTDGFFDYFNSKKPEPKVKENNCLFELNRSEIYDKEYAAEPYINIYNENGSNMKSLFPVENEELSYLEDSIHEPLFSPYHSQNFNTRTNLDSPYKPSDDFVMLTTREYVQCYLSSDTSPPMSLASSPSQSDKFQIRKRNHPKGFLEY